MSCPVSHLLNKDRKAINGSRILVLGLAYKPNTGDARESPGPVICERLQALGGEIRASDPHVPHSRFPQSLARVEVTGRVPTEDITLIATDHDAFPWELVLSTSRRVFDTRHRLPAAENLEYL